jgi:hypothetical protein
LCWHTSASLLIQENAAAVRPRAIAAHLLGE